MRTNLLTFILCVFLTQFATGQAVWHQYQGPYVGGVASYVAKSDTIFVGTPMGVYSSIDNGNTWAITGLKDGWHNALLINKNLFISQQEYSEDNGKNWSPYLNGWFEGFRALYSFNGIVYAGTDNGVFRFNPENKSWTSKSRGIKGEESWQKDSVIQSLTSIGNTLLCGTFNKGLFFSKDSGETWNKSTTPYSTVMKLLNYKDDLFAVADGGIYTSADSAKNWINIQYNLIGSAVKDVAVLNDTIIVSTTNGVLKYDKSNSKWKSFSNESFETLFVNGNVFLASNSYGLYKWNGKNSQFELSNSGINTARVLDMELFNKRLYCVTEVGAFYTPDDGKSWEEIVETKNRYCHTIAKNDSMLFIGTGDAGIFATSINSNNWKQMNTGLTSNGIWDIETNGNTLFAATDAGPFISKNQGKNWVQILDGFEHTNSSSQYGSGQIQALSIASGSGMVLASNNFGLYKLSNDSTKWDLVGFPEQGGSMIKIIDNVVYFGKELGGLYMSTDSCKTWISLNINNFTPVIYDIFKRGDNNLYAASCQLYYSPDGGKNWDEWSETGTPRLPIRRVIQGDSSLYAGTYGRSIYKREYLKLTDCTSSVYNISGSSITNIPENTPTDSLQLKLTLAHGASSEIVSSKSAEVVSSKSTKAVQTYVKSGDIIKVIAEDGKTSKNYIVQVITGLNKLSGSDLKIYPTLTNDQIYFSQPNEIESIIIYNSQGQILLNQKNTNNSIDVSNLKNGIYFLSIINNDSQKIEVKFIKE